MINTKNNQYSITVDIKGDAISQEELDSKRTKLKAFYKSNISFIIALLVLSIVITYRAITLDYDKEFELFYISLYIGIWFGLFTGLMIDGNAKRKLQMVFVATLLSSSASLFGSMLMMLIIGKTTAWISSINILASALANMWVMTRYDEVLKGVESVSTVNKKQFSYIKKVTMHSKELYQFSEKIIAEERMPLRAEYWAFRDWVYEEKKAKN